MGATMAMVSARLISDPPPSDQRHFGGGQHEKRQAEREGGIARDLGRLQHAAARDQLEHEGGDAEGERHIGRTRHAAGFQQGEGQAAIGDELALRHEDHPRDGKDQHKREAEQGIDGAIGDTVLHEEQDDGQIHGVAPPDRGLGGIRPPVWNAGMPPPEGFL